MYHAGYRAWGCGEALMRHHCSLALGILRTGHQMLRTLTIAELALSTMCLPDVSSTAFSLLFILLTSESSFHTDPSDLSESKSHTCNLTAREFGSMRIFSWAHYCTAKNFVSANKEKVESGHWVSSLQCLILHELIQAAG